MPTMRRLLTDKIMKLPRLSFFLGAAMVSTAMLAPAVTWATQVTPPPNPDRVGPSLNLFIDRDDADTTWLIYQAPCSSGSSGLGGLNSGLPFKITQVPAPPATMPFYYRFKFDAENALVTPEAPMNRDDVYPGAQYIAPNGVAGYCDYSNPGNYPTDYWKRTPGQGLAFYYGFGGEGKVTGEVVGSGGYNTYFTVRFDKVIPPSPYPNEQIGFASGMDIKFRLAFHSIFIKDHKILNAPLVGHTLAVPLGMYDNLPLSDIRPLLKKGTRVRIGGGYSPIGLVAGVPAPDPLIIAILPPDTSFIAPPPPTVTASCNRPGNTLSVSWKSPGATSYKYHADDKINGWKGNDDCSDNPQNPGDTCISPITETSASVPSTHDHTYEIWIAACNSEGCSTSSNPPGNPITCASSVDSTGSPTVEQQIKVLRQQIQDILTLLAQLVKLVSEKLK